MSSSGNNQFIVSKAQDLSPEWLKKLHSFDERFMPFAWSLSQWQGESANKASCVFMMISPEKQLRAMALVHLIASSTEAYLLKIAVDSQYLKSGLAWKLWSRVESELQEQGVGALYLEVQQSNTHAINWYQRQGFEIMTLRKSFYSNGEDAYSMVYRY